MSTFAFQAKTIQGKTIKGTIEAENDIEVRVKLKTRHLIPVKVTQQKSAALNAGSKNITLPWFKGVPAKELQAMTRQLSTLINSGIPILNGISILIGSTQNKNLKKALEDIARRIEDGSDLSDGLAAHPHIFDSSYIGMVRSGEKSGTLDTTFQDIATHIEKSEKIKGKIKSALWYPAIVVCISALVIGVMMVFVIPQFEELFASANMKLPAVTQMVLGLSHFISSYWYLIFAGIIGFGFACITFYKSKPGRKLVDTNLLKLPVFGQLIQKGCLARSCRTFASMLSSGVFALECLEISADTAGNYVIEKAFRDAKDFIVDGGSMTVPFSKNKYIPNMMVQMIGIGEQTGSLDALMTKLATFYEEEVEQLTSALLSLIEPLMIVFLGLIIGFIVVALYLPIFQIAEGF